VRYYPSDEELLDGPLLSKSELRAIGQEAMAKWDKPILRYPTVLNVKCICGHRARVKIPAGKRVRLRCTKCGFLSL